MRDGRAALQMIVQGVGDIGSAVAVALFREGYQVAIVDGPQPQTTRRKMAFADAVFDGSATLEGITAIRIDDPSPLDRVLAARELIPVVVSDLDDLRVQIRPNVIVDARMRKRVQPESQRGQDPLTIGLGPNFVAGETVDLAIETAWGDDLGTVIRAGATRPLGGEPRAIAGHALDRYVYAPVAGVFNTAAVIGERVLPDQSIARIGDRVLRAPLTGVLRGLTHDGVRVATGAKVIEVDPRLDGAVVCGIGERPARIAVGVLAAVRGAARALRETTDAAGMRAGSPGQPP